MASTYAGRSLRLLGATVVVAGLGAGAAYATTVMSRSAGAGGVIQACANPGNGNLRAVESAADCRKNETPLSWNTAGPPGPPGVSPTVTALSPGDPNCPAGGAAITDAAGSTAYACSGESFDGTFTSPNGQYRLRVDDTGIELRGPNSQTVTISGTQVKVEGVNLELKGQGSTKLEGQGTLDLRAGGIATLQSGGLVTVEGGHVSINPAGCTPAARLGDGVAGGIITGGSLTVCIGD